ncbi:MAG TPA: hypothetical protein VHN77_05305 [Phycisphaerales bacterium]|nr:hypothetical protein [Phycisphaerales bacterium]
MRRTSALALIMLCGAAGAVHAALSQAVITPPGGFVQAAAYPSTNGCLGGVTAGNDITTGCGTGADFDEQAFSGAASASASAANSTPGAFGPLSQSTSGTAGLGYIRSQGSNAYTDYAQFANAVFDGGWNESFTVSHPSLNGQSGYMVVRLRARGQMHTQGLSGSAIVEISPYKNHALITWNPYFLQEGSDSIVGIGSNQYARWGLASYGQPDNRTVDAYVTMSVPITFGTPFTLGVYARFTAAQRSSGGFNGPSSDWLDFSTRGVEWAGITSIRNAGGTVVNGSTIVSGSGTDWVPPLGSCDSIDYNGDGLFPDTQDIDDFLSVFSGGPCSTGTCGDIDFNNDGLFPDTSDIDSLLSVFSGGACV